MTEGPRLEGPTFDLAFPFAFRVDQLGRLDHVGPSLRRLFPELEPGKSIGDHFEVIRPAGRSLADLHHDARALVVLRHKLVDVVMRGQVVGSHDGRLTFIGGPWVTSIKDMQTLGIAINDFAVHDSSVDMLFLFQAQRRTIEETRELADRLREKSKEADAAHAASRGLLSTFSHGLRTPLHNMLGMLERARAARQLEETVEPLAAAADHTRRLEKLIARTLTLIELQDHPDARQEPVEAWQTVMAAAQKASPFDLRRSLRLRPPLATPHHWLLLDPTLVTIVVEQLVEIALLHGGGGSVELSTEVAEDGHHLTIHLFDEGSGVFQERVEQLTALRAGAPTEAPSRNEVGHHLIDAAVSKMKGSIEIHRASHPYTGTRVSVRVPCRPADPPATPVSRPTQSRRRLRVFIVDDAPDNRRLAAWALEDVGHEVGLATNGSDALWAAATQDWDVILMDLEMPGMDGISAARRLLGTDGGPKVALGEPRVIAFTAHDLVEFRDRCADAGMSGFLVKPQAARGIVDAVEAHLGLAEREPTHAIPAWLHAAFADDLIELGQEILQAETVPDLQPLLHRLAGSSSSYGYGELAGAVRALSAELASGREWRGPRAQLVDDVLALARSIPRP